MNVLVTYASRHGSTAGIAERIAARIEHAGIPAVALPVGQVRTVETYDAVVLGSAAYMTRWLKDARNFAKRHRAGLQATQVWLFSSGPLGHEVVTKDGKDILETSRPKDFDELQAELHPRGERVFHGAWNPESRPVGIGERLVRLAPASTGALPAGDFRHWDEIDAWADEIAANLGSHTPQKG